VVAIWDSGLRGQVIKLLSLYILPPGAPPGGSD